MTEIELKFQVPPAAQAAVKAELQAAGAGHAPAQTRLQAVYFDTPDRRLAHAGIAVRLRLEGAQWVQTAKAGDPHAMQRHEHNVPVAGAADGSPPALDLARHAATPAGALIAGALEGVPVAALYRTDILRTHRRVPAGGGEVELALDVGEITAADRRWPVHELEIELVAGQAADVLEAAAGWVRRHGLWLDVRSKAERGDRLARGVTRGQPVAGRVFPAGASAAAVAAQGLAHLLPNASEVAGGDFTPGHLHQLRVALRHLARGLRACGIPATWADRWHPALRTGEGASQAVREVDFTLLLLSVQAQALRTGGQGTAGH